MGNFFGEALKKITGKKEKPYFILTGLITAGKQTMLYKKNALEGIQRIIVGYSDTLSCFNGIETFEYDKYTIYCWHLPERPKQKALYDYFYEHAKGLIFMVDSNDRERLTDIHSANLRVNLLTFSYIRRSFKDFNYNHCKEKWSADITYIIFEYCKYQQGPENDEQTAKDLMHSILSDRINSDIPLLIYANKQDLPNAISVDEVGALLQLNKIKNRKCHIQSLKALNITATTCDGMYAGLKWLCDASGINDEGKK